MAKTLSGGNFIGQMLVLTIRIMIERKVCYLRVRAFFSQRLTAAISRIVLPTIAIIIIASTISNIIIIITNGEGVLLLAGAGFCLLLGKDGATKSDKIVRKNSKRPSTPPSFSENHVANLL